MSPNSQVKTIHFLKQHCVSAFVFFPFSPLPEHINHFPSLKATSPVDFSQTIVGWTRCPKTPSDVWLDWTVTDPSRELTRTLSLHRFFVVLLIGKRKGENIKNNEHVSNSAREQTARRKNGEKSYTAEKASRDKCEVLVQADSNCSVCKSQCACIALFTANMVFSWHRLFSVPEAGDFLLFFFSLPFWSSFPNNFPNALASCLQFYRQLQALLISDILKLRQAG